MRVKQGLLVLVMLLICLTHTRAQSSEPSAVVMLRNADVLRMLAEGKKSAEIINQIQVSSCNFDIFPPVLRDLKRRGVPDTVILVMKMAPNGPPRESSAESPLKSLTTQVKIPAGTVIEVETAQALSSAKATEGSGIIFFVTKRVFLDKALVIERGAVAKAKVVKVKRAGAWGRPGMLAWAMEYVVAVDGTRIPLSVTGEQRGANRLAAVAGGAVATGALIFPYSSPVALIWGLKKGDEAILRGSKLFNATVPAETEVAGIPPRPGGVVYHDRQTVKASAAPPTNTNFERGFKARGGFRP